MGNKLEYSQTKNLKTNGFISSCKISFNIIDSDINYISTFTTSYIKNFETKYMTFEYELHINKNTGNFKTTYKIINYYNDEFGKKKETIRTKSNDFKHLLDLIEDGMIKGEKRVNFWGVKYNKFINKVFDEIINTLSLNFKNEYYKKKNHKEKYTWNVLFDFLVDYYLDKNNIKGHNLVYSHILNEFPKKKWLRLNDNKYLPSVLDSYGIKNRYLISILNDETNDIEISGLNFICKLFGDNYIDYIKKIDWIKHSHYLTNKKTFTLKNDSEKNFMVQLFNNFDESSHRTLITNLNYLLSMKEFLEQKGLDLKFNATTNIELELLIVDWSRLKNYFTKGYKMRYIFPDGFVEMIEEEININSKVFKPKILLSEEDFSIEGFKMKNCMGKQFVHGVVFIYISLYCNNKTINLQYKNGNLYMLYGKANTPVEEYFEDGVEILTQRLLSQSKIKWTKERYDYIN